MYAGYGACAVWYFYVSGVHGQRQQWKQFVSMGGL